MNKNIIIVGIILGVIAVILGALAAHGLKSVIPVKALQSFETGVRYQMYHALFLIILSIIPNVSSLQKKRIYFFILGGVILFSGSIYLLATNSLTSVDFRIIGFVTPFGGLMIIIGWLLLLVYVLRNRTN